MTRMLQPAVVLVADRTLCGDYRILFEGIFATMQTTQVPGLVMRRFVSPPVARDQDGRAVTAPLGLRRIESALIAQTGLGPDDVVCTTPEGLPALLGPWVKVVCVSSSDPLGGGMSNTTTAWFCRGELYTKRWTRELLESLNEARERYGFQVVFGGAGAWQFVRDMDTARSFGIDTVFQGYFESQGPALISQMLEGGTGPALVNEPGNAADDVQAIRHASAMGIIELSRGCGKGCRFCTMASMPMAHLSEDLILADLETNVAAGVRSVVSGSEDFFRYGARGPAKNFDRLHGLLTAMHQVKGLRFMQIDHGNVSSIVQYTEEELREVRRLLTWEKDARYLWVNMGVESANGRLVVANSPGKMAPHDPDDWEALVETAGRRLLATGFFPVYSIVLGLPGETPDDVLRTKRLVDRLSEEPAVVFPVFYEPVEKDDAVFNLSRMRSDHLALFTQCYELNFRWVPRLYRDNQWAGGVPWWKRMMVQCLGRTEIVTWRRRFRKLGRALAAH